jgi:phospholipid transport system substrate-binding protein
MSFLSRFLLLAFLTVFAFPAAAQAPVAPDEKIRVLSAKVLERIRADPGLKAGDINRISQFVDEMVMPHVNFERMTALAVGRNWRQATPEQQKRLMEEFRALLLRTYSGALSAVQDQSIEVRPFRGDPTEKEVVVRTQVLQPRGEPVQLDYRLERAGNDWRIFDVNVLGLWLVETYRNQFAQEISARGIDGLIQTLAERNQKVAQEARR